jgi:16S rRNA (cytidine1402-2'-O)-methyltransferase
MDSPGMLYLVPTPIGNLKDMTFRAVEVLRGADLILAEDTRTTGVLLKHYDISTGMQSYHAHNEHKAVRRFIDLLKAGKNIALVSDAGTPGLSDPGYLITREAIAQEIRVECLPGANAAIPALVQSGFPMERFTFEGFVPHKKGRMTRLREIMEEERTSIVYESPHRLVKTLTQFREIGGERRVSVSRELSKLHEETVRGSLSELIDYFSARPPRGECVIVLQGLKTK